MKGTEIKYKMLFFFWIDERFGQESRYQRPLLILLEAAEVSGLEQTGKCGTTHETCHTCVRLQSAKPLFRAGIK